MRVCFRDVDGEVCGIFYIIVSVCCKAHKVGATALAFYHIGDCFLIKMILSEDANYEGSVFDEGDGAVFEFACCVGFCVYVADFFHFQAAFHADGIIDATTDKESVFCICLFGCEPLDTFFVVFDDLGDLIRKGFQFCDQLLVFLFCNLLSYSGELYCQGIGSDELSAVCFCGCYGDFRTARV